MPLSQNHFNYISNHQTLFQIVDETSFVIGHLKRYALSLKWLRDNMEVILQVYFPN